jgi:hypothetical protein
MPVQIHGKNYVTVAERVQAAHEAGVQSIVTDLVIGDGARYIVKATVTLGDGRTFTGYAEQTPGDAGIAGQSPLEVAETSAVGRALGFAGFGSTEAIATADEVQGKQTAAGNGKVKPADVMTSYWIAVKAKGLTQAQGRELLAQHGGDAAKALAEIE